MNRISSTVMIDIKQLREHPDLYEQNMRKKNREDVSVIKDALALDEQWRILKHQADIIRKQRNDISKEINQAKKEGKNISELVVKAKNTLKELEKSESKEKELEEKLTQVIKRIPNLMNESVPQGKDDSDNVELARMGPAPRSRAVKPHQEVVEDLGLADFESSATTSGNGFYFMQGDLALLNRALLQYAVDVMITKGFTYVETPLLLRNSVISKVVDLRDQEEQIYKIDGEDAYLIGTSEHSLIGRFIDTTINEEDLPLKHTSYSMCFRKEKGSHGLDEKGFFRTHQFNKIEMIVICRPEESMEFYKAMQDITIEIFTGLELPTRVLQICSGDLGDLKHTQVDIEVWSPRRDNWIEVGSCSNLTDAQARSLGIRVQGKSERYTPHTLNNTAIATSRALVAILENCQNDDGTVTIPQVLHKYMYGKTKLEKQRK